MVKKFGKVVEIMSGSREKRKVTHARRRGLKDNYLMVRVDADQKTRIEQLAEAEESSVSGYVRDVLLKLTRGWRLLPPE